MAKVNEIKASQSDLDNRLNETFLRMRGVINKQSEVINSIFGLFDKDIEMNK